MSRSSKKAPFVEDALMKRVNKAAANNEKKPIKTYSRSSVIYPEFVNQTIMVYNGRKFIPVYCTAEMVGYKLGEFAQTRTFKSHPVKGDKKAEPAAAKTGDGKK